ncbi:MAG: nucleoside-diphosphate kinase [Candidatus Cloacimonadaceae bacterium]|jgi:nucleoside-diphosphate kinase|nr:nucleoside-diphosphate kinase [Candidatus Cloacimonadota bacterium]MCB5258672.1 nucleoside-diphosphate kinase [Candidatus Cloacimonadota bacterium]MDD5625338.1 nucleoside-diphosphate kinase [Candidatus Cloacimonadota bacterium]MDY0112179.1 nucleoside-diphosphate kinase [Candidatus Syntrophosphaera sp.]
MIEQSLLIIKPNAVIHHHIGHIISMVEEAGFKIKYIQTIQFTPELASVFYEMHKGKSFYDQLVNFMCSAPCVGIIVEKNNAIEGLRDLIGDVNPEERKAGTIRDFYAESITENAVHASDSKESAEREIAILFPQYLL